MSWALHAREALQRGETVTMRPRGNSMQPKIYSGQLVTVQPCASDALKVGDIVLVRVHGYDYLHLIKAIQGERFLIGNNRGRINGWVNKQAIYGVVTAVES